MKLHRANHTVISYHHFNSGVTTVMKLLVPWVVSFRLDGFATRQNLALALKVKPF